MSKTALAKKIQHKMGNAIVISESNIAETIREALMSIYGKSNQETHCVEYLYKVQPIEHRQLVKAVEHLVEYNNCDVIAVGQFFMQFSNEEWIKSMRSFGELHGYDVEFLFLQRSKGKSTTVQEVLNMRKNKIFRRKVDECIKNIRTSEHVAKYTTCETL